jgi:hypothetical protein
MPDLQGALEVNEKYPTGAEEMPSLGLDPAMAIYPVPG